MKSGISPIIPLELTAKIKRLQEWRASELSKANPPGVTEIKESDFKRVHLIVKMMDEEILKSFNILFNSPEATPGVIHFAILDFLAMDDDYLNFFDVCFKNHFRNKLLTEAVVARHILYKKLFKRMLEYPELKDLPLVAAIAQSLCVFSSALTKEMSAVRSWTEAIFYANSLLEWLPYFSHVPDVYQIYNPSYDKLITYSISPYVEHMRAQANFVFYNSFRALKKENTIGFLKQCIEHQQSFCGQVFNAMLNECREAEKNEDYSLALYLNFSMLKYIAKYHNKLVNDSLTRADANLPHLKESRVRLLKKLSFQYKEHFEIQYFDDLKITFDKLKLRIATTDPSAFSRTTATALIRSLPNKKMDISFEEGVFTIENPHHFQMRDLDGLIKRIRYKLQELKNTKEKHNSVEEDIWTLADNLLDDLNISTGSTSSCSSTDDNTPKGEKVKTRGPLIFSTPQGIPQSSPTPTVKSIGFTPKLSSLKENEPVYELNGRMIAEKTYYVLWGDPDLSSMSPDEIEKHRENIKNAEVVSGHSGIRMVRPRESGLKELTFKSTISRKDARIWFTKVDEIFDAEGNVLRTLFSANKTRYHKK